MWAIVPFHVGRHYGDVGRCLGDAVQSNSVSEIDVRIAPRMGRLGREILVRWVGEQAFSSM
jgi:hypothetical protein